MAGWVWAMTLPQMLLLGSDFSGGCIPNTVTTVALTGVTSSTGLASLPPPHIVIDRLHLALQISWAVYVDVSSILQHIILFMYVI